LARQLLGLSWTRRTKTIVFVLLTTRYLNEDLLMTMKKTAISTAMAMAMGTAAMAPQIAAADTVTFSWNGLFTILDGGGGVLANSSLPKTGNQFQTDINGTFTFDTATGSGTGTVDPFDFFKGTSPAQAKDFAVQSIGGNLVLGNALFDWNGNYNIPVSLVWDATGLFNNLSAAVGGFFGGCTGTSCTISGTGAAPASDGSYTNGTYGYLNQGPTPLATTFWNTTNVPGCAPGSCINVNPSGMLPLVTDTAENTNIGYSTPGNMIGVGGNPMQDGPFAGFNANFDASSLTVTGYTVAPIPVPAAVWLFGSGLLGLVGVARRRKS
jgi:hypothetical protein